MNKEVIKYQNGVYNAKQLKQLNLTDDEVIEVLKLYKRILSMQDLQLIDENDEYMCKYNYSVIEKREKRVDNAIAKLKRILNGEAVKFEYYSHLLSVEVNNNRLIKEYSIPMIYDI